MKNVLFQRGTPMFLCLFLTFCSHNITFGQSELTSLIDQPYSGSSPKWFIELDPGLWLNIGRSYGINRRFLGGDAELNIGKWVKGNDHLRVAGTVGLKVSASNLDQSLVENWSLIFNPYVGSRLATGPELIKNGSALFEITAGLLFEDLRDLNNPYFGILEGFSSSFAFGYLVTKKDRFNYGFKMDFVYARNPIYETHRLLWMTPKLMLHFKI